MAEIEMSFDGIRAVANTLDGDLKSRATTTKNKFNQDPLGPGAAGGSAAAHNFVGQANAARALYKDTLANLVEDFGAFAQEFRDSVTTATETEEAVKAALRSLDPGALTLRSQKAYNRHLDAHGDVLDPGKAADEAAASAAQPTSSAPVRSNSGGFE